MSQIVQLHIRLYPDRDQRLIAWFKSLPDSYGAKTDAAKRMLKAGVVAMEDNPGVKSSAHTVLDAGNLQSLITQEITEALPGELLPAIRQIVQNVVHSELANVELTSNNPTSPDKDSGIEDNLDAMGDLLVDQNL